MNKEVFQKLAELESQKKVLESAIATAREEVAEEMKKVGADKVESELGNFFFTSRKTWSYSPELKEDEEALKKRKKFEEEKGIATATESQSLTFRAAKE